VICRRDVKFFIEHTENDELPEQSLAVGAIKSELSAAVIHAASVVTAVNHLGIL